MAALTFLPEARDDIDAAYSAYELRQDGLGERFLAALKRTLGVITENPLLYGRVLEAVRAAVLRRFPYVVYYRDVPDEVLILAVRHGSDNPMIWQGRS